MSLRIAFDLDGVLADLEGAYRSVVERLFGPDPTEHTESGDRHPDETRSPESGSPAGFRGADAIAGQRPPDGPALARWQEDEVWREIRATPDFWATLEPLEPGIIMRLQSLALHHRWEIFFVTQRPETAGETVQRQTQRWLMKCGFDMPSVLVLSGSRGRVAAALGLDFLIDDSPQHCIDVTSESSTQAVLILRRNDPVAARRARQLRLEVMRTVAAALDHLEQAQAARFQPGLLKKIAKTFGLQGED